MKRGTSSSEAYATVWSFRCVFVATAFTARWSRAAARGWDGAHSDHILWRAGSGPAASQTRCVCLRRNDNRSLGVSSVFVVCSREEQDLPDPLAPTRGQYWVPVAAIRDPHTPPTPFLFLTQMNATSQAGKPLLCCDTGVFVALRGKCAVSLTEELADVALTLDHEKRDDKIATHVAQPRLVSQLCTSLGIAGRACQRDLLGANVNHSTTRARHRPVTWLLALALPDLLPLLRGKQRHHPDTTGYTGATCLQHCGICYVNGLIIFFSLTTYLLIKQVQK